MDEKTFNSFDVLAQVLGTFFTACATASASNRPPGRNAANGYFIGAMKNFGYEALQQSEPALEEPRLVKILDAYRQLNRGFRTAFNIENYNAAWYKNLPVLSLTLGEFWGEILGVVTAIFQLAEGNDTESGDEEQQKLAEAIEALWNAVNGSTLVTHGTHGNGWVSGGVGSNGESAANMLDNAGLNDPPRDGIDRLGFILRAAGRGFQGINNKVHRPWLRADWQAEFEAISLATAAGIKRLRLNEAASLVDADIILKGDAAYVAAGQRHEVLHFARRYALTETEVLSLIKQVGNERKALRAEVHRKRINKEKILVPDDPKFASFGPA